MRRFLLIFVMMLWCLSDVFAEVETSVGKLEELVKSFEKNPSDVRVTTSLLKELNKQGKPLQNVVNKYFMTQKEDDYFKDYNWAIVRDYVDDVNAPQIRYILKNCNKFLQYFSKDDVYQKLDNVLVDHLDILYKNNKASYMESLKKLQQSGYAHYDIVSDYFYIRELRSNKNAEDYFYKARKLFRYFPENRKMIKEITAGALEIMTDVSRLKVIQLWAGKTVESKSDFDAICNYVKISQKCGFRDVAKQYSSIANNLAMKSNNQLMKKQAVELMNSIK